MNSAITKHISANRQLSTTSWEERVADASMAQHLVTLLKMKDNPKDRAIEALKILFSLHGISSSDIRIERQEFADLPEDKRKEKDKITICHSFDDNRQVTSIHFAEDHTHLEHYRLSMLNRLKVAMENADPAKDITITPEFADGASALHLKTAQLNLPFHHILETAARGAIEEKISFLKFTPFAPRMSAVGKV